jgi:hypothetical protein
LAREVGDFSTPCGSFDHSFYLPQGNHLPVKVCGRKMVMLSALQFPTLGIRKPACSLDQMLIPDAPLLWASLTEPRKLSGAFAPPLQMPAWF